MTSIVWQSSRHLVATDVTTLYGVKTDMPVLERVPSSFCPMPVVFAADNSAPSSCVATAALYSNEISCVSTVFALYNRKPTFMAFSTLLIVAEYASLGVWGYGLISEIEVVDGVCVTGYKAVFIR